MIYDKSNGVDEQTKRYFASYEDTVNLKDTYSKLNRFIWGVELIIVAIRMVDNNVT